ncbi:MAG: glutamine amidotransferase [Pirellulaceae bacterium]|nr:glutamine amidotransferase [Pirellulaceae bacterium]
MDSLSVEPVFGWYTVIPLAVIMLASLWLTLTNTAISRGGRWTLVLLRLAAAIVLLLGWLRPGLISTNERESAGAIAVLLDQSQSMTLPSETSNKDRFRVQQEVWSAIVSATDLKIGQTKIVPYFFDSSLRKAPEDDVPSLQRSFKVSPNGKLTDLGKTLAELQRTQVDPPLRGVILVSDATQTALPPEVEPTSIASQMAQLDQPLLVVGIGPRTNRSQFRDIAVEGLPEHLDAFEKKELQIPLILRAQGVQNQPIKLSFTLRASGKPDQVLAAEQVSATEPTQSISRNIKMIAPEEGEYLLQIDAKADINEQVTTNNTAIAFVTVRKGGARILYLEGEPRYEQQFLKRSLNSSRDFVVDYGWIQEKSRRSWPIDFSKPPVSLDFSKYDVILLGDIDSSAIHPDNLSAIRQRVSKGAGLLLMGGYHSFDAGGYGNTTLAPAFPVALGKGRSQAFDQPVDPNFQTSEPTRIKLINEHPITSLVPEPENGKAWENLKPLMSINRLGKPKVEPGVKVLAASEKGEPILVTGEFGTGRVLAFAGDTTWQWWLSGDQQIHKQFWRQAVLWLLRRDAIDEGFVMKLDRRRLSIDDTTGLHMEWFGGTDNKPMPEKIKVELTREGKFLRNLETVADGASRRDGKLSGLDQPGLHRAALTAEGADGKTYTSEIAFIVRDESRELAQPSADWQMMSNLVSANNAAGGRLLLPEDIADGIEWLRNRQETTKVTTLEKRRLGDAAWDSWLYLIIFCGLMTTEWALRKSWQMP